MSAAELMALEAQLKTKTDEALALQRANYFAQSELWSDVLQGVFSVKNSAREML